jgi:2-octaprenylphenol hydroxylase
MVGAALAVALSNTDLRIGLLESRPLPKQFRNPDIDFDLRVSAITRASQNILDNIGCWDHIDPQRAWPYEKMHVWDGNGDGKIIFDAADGGTANLGHIIENNSILDALYAQLKNSAIEIIAPASCIALEQQQHQVATQLADGTSVSSRLLIGADGAQSWVRKQIGIRTIGWPYDQKGVVATVKLANSHQFTAWQKFLTSGPIAFLPMQDPYCSIVWSTTTEHADELVTLSEDELLGQINQVINDAPFKSVESVSKAAAFPLQLKHAQHYTDHRVALIGDAAHAIHPLAGQGVNLGFLDAATLAETILHAHENAKDFGHAAVLRQYERKRKANNLLVMSLMDGFKRVFGSDNQYLVTARNLGLNVCNAATPLKNELIARAMGLKGDLPELAQQVIAE